MSNTRFHLEIILVIVVICGLILSACAPAVPSIEDSLIAPYQGELERQQLIAQAVALNYDELKTAVTDPVSGESLRSEVFGVYPARPSDLSQGSAACEGRDCYRVDVYNYASNSTISAVVNIQGREVVEFVALESVQPEVPSEYLVTIL